MKLPNLEKAKIRTNSKTKTEEIEYFASDKFIGKKYFIKTYGCQMNTHDSEQIVAILKNFKMEETSTLEEADVAILNTCAIRENAHNKTFGMLGRIKHLKQHKKDLFILITSISKIQF